jgi:hypothetical protein
MIILVIALTVVVLALLVRIILLPFSKQIRQQVRKRPFLHALWLLAALFVVAGFFVGEKVPPNSLTAGSMHMCKRRVLRYAREHNRLPLSLSETMPIKGYNSSIKDGWGVVLEYSYDTNGIVCFRSLGKDRKMGGSGDNLDMTRFFPARSSGGSWSDEFVGWMRDPPEKTSVVEPVRAD